ncbi:acyl-CoA dehydrogenase C-terminal domain-containing protein [Caulobacter vibrioides]|uniref:3-methylmercaptopropionyl-CoA dehydrogenase n=2 Tax=Caulobacter vibrioides TaxID=155892 RepID=Q9ABZ0_CAUVC|nr:acyl-CoA dehydrogenase C-terminal domain-containing protein [Caulobacter vibrioides]YP_002515453.1 acyl-CoA dehydrogenase [Caulobacter vibrioides NA1000]AAK22067.1 acyl-CoA dehydrogenase family protein [Caulobacter vibrioides CB15]ACL93545.1 acyl-CoA dehydrogenase [Caulobacter vibrioides NA1000]ATC26915.1 acyl-CoA dehydrogenase [Caulobacter vibrioides]QXZ52174.1 acyl-CoA dehydrogenase C-terminal domain-containing protein [Caulobacter vibrioides]
MTYQPPVRDHAFILRDVLNIDQHGDLPGFSDAPFDVVEQILEAAAQFTGEVLAPLNTVGDKTGCKLDPVTNTVTTPPGFKDAYKQMCEGGWTAIGSDPAYGGQGLPHVVNLAFSEMSSSANMAFSMYPGLAHGAYSAIHVGGSDEQKQTFLPKMVSGEWTGTMNLTEPHCGTDLGLLRTKAVPQADGSYKITGQKIWISAGEHDMADNIVHLVLARIEGAPAGVKGISLFIVPKFIPNADGSVGPRNEGAKCVGLEEKMGIHGNATCVMQYDEAVGYLIGEENSGLKIMFVMMNEARLGVGMQGVAQGEAAYQAAVAFAKDRLQGRSLTGPKNAEGPADPIIVHPDVRRMLLESKALIEGGRAFLFWTALHGDLSHVHPDPAVREKSSDYMGLMTPVLKGYLTDKGFQVCSNAVQVHGGSGFTEHFPVSQFMRDCRIALIYEGTNGVQALDLVGRKLAAKGGRAVMTFFQEIDQFIGENDSDEALKPFIEALGGVKAQLQDGTMWLMQNGLQNPDNAGAASTDYMHLFGLAGLAYMWALMAKAANAKIAAGSSDPFFTTKLTTGRYFIERILPDAASHLAKLKTGSATLMALPAEAF